MNDLSVTLKLYNEDEVRRIAVCSINNASTTDHGTPRVGGLNDARMGSTDRSILCQTCHVPHCAGHLGMIEFPQRVLLSGHIKYVVAMLRCVCVCCSEPLADFAQFEHVEPGFEKLKIIAEFCRNKVSECRGCGSPVVEYAESNKIFITKTAPLEKM
jgi:DNA-directed RNA polymerase beta' subunit